MADDVLTPDQIDDLKQRVTALLPGVRTDLEALVRIPSVSLDSFDQQHVDDSALAVAQLLRGRGARRGDRP